MNYQIRACRQQDADLIEWASSIAETDFYTVYEGRPADNGRIEYYAIADFDTEKQAELFVAEKQSGE